jgi:2-polyprenyl-3-methyl-5-hydroxy-6-metoxy-1,4-benzoquinol methylase
MTFLYDYQVDFDDPNSKNSWFGRIIGNEKQVLEVGCATGYIGEYLAKNQNCLMFGVEYNLVAAQKAKERGCYSEVITGDIQDKLTVKHLKEETFDFILFGDVLEHLMKPELALQNVKYLLKPEGSILICVPSIVHWSIRRDILLGKFEYTESGPLDRTHIHFFTPKTIRDLIRKENFEIVEESGIVWLPKFVYKLPQQARRSIESILARLSPKIVFGQILLNVKPLK